MNESKSLDVLLFFLLLFGFLLLFICLGLLLEEAIEQPFLILWNAFFLWFSLWLRDVFRLEHIHALE